MPLRFGRSVPEFEDAVRQVFVNGITDLSRFDISEFARKTIDEGFSVLELSMDVRHIFPDSFNQETIHRLAALKEESGTAYSVHLPFWSVELSSFNKYIQQGSIESTIDAISLVEPLEPEVYVLHVTGGLATYFTSLSYGENLRPVIAALLSSLSLSSLEEITSRTDLEPRRLAIENVEFPFVVTRELIDELDLSICFDTAHLLSRMSGTELIMEFYRNNKDRIAEIHLQDGIYHEFEGAVSREDHIPLGHGLMGANVLREFLLEMVSDKFGGPIIFELPDESVQESMNLIKKVAPEALY